MFSVSSDGENYALRILMTSKNIKRGWAFTINLNWNEIFTFIAVSHAGT